MKSMATFDLKSVYHAVSVTATIVAMLVAAQPTVAAILPVTDFFSYDGSYDPASGTPPVGQDTWTVVTTGGLSISPNAPSAGLAEFTDNSISGRIGVNKTYGDASFLADPTETTWSYVLEMQIDSMTGTASQQLLFGVRSEGSGNGKTVMLNWNPTDGTLGFSIASGAGELFSLGTTDLRDGVFRTYRVDKYDDGGTMRVRAFLDGALLGTFDYSTFEDDASTEGFGRFTSTPGTSVAVVDRMLFGSAQAVPEPSSVALALMGIFTLGVCKWRRRKTASLV